MTANWPNQQADFGAGRSAAVIVASTSAAAGRADDVTGPLLVDWLSGRGYDCPAPIVVADGPPVAEALFHLLLELPEDDRPRIVVTTGGTGLNPDDRTPQVTQPLLDYPTPGIMHALWSEGLKHVPTAVMSRGVAGVRGRTFIVNLPGSKGGVRDGIAVLDPIIHHIQAQIEDVRDHPPRLLTEAAVTERRDEDEDGGPVTYHPAADRKQAATPTPASATRGSDTVTRGPASAAQPVTRPGENIPRPFVHAAITTEAIDVGAVQAAVTTPETGAAVVFRGIIRNHDEGRTDVIALDYTSHPDAEAIMRRVVSGVAADHLEVRIVAVHRIGPLAIGEDALVVATASAHRAEAFACAAEAVDAIKAEVPIWKQQRYAAGDHSWVGLADE
ncbi:molybdenum cofactor biosynthesis protein MoaE [Brevibacterium daeguense]|uniref:Molybdenum cofactor biosynthesis protein MoaE n=1 Tax=Brevibacterium daeguense TaxID=909936 RepID=A0ABP8EJW7_9MICO|nr:molybdenum cofactor biosynthesis protein MoaE [Brevibacterium daeguense]